MKDPAWIAALFAVLGLFLGIGWLFLAMTAVFVALIAAGSVDNAPAHGHGHDSHGSHGHDSHGHASGHDSHSSHAVHAEPKPIGGFLDVLIGQLIFAKKTAKKDESKPATTAAPAAHDNHHDHEHEHDPRPTIFKGDVFHDHDAAKDWRYKAFNRKTGGSDHGASHDDHGGHH